MANFHLSPGQIDEYKEEGVLVLPSLLDEQAVRSLNETIDSLVEDALERGDETVLELEPELQDGAVVVHMNGPVADMLSRAGELGAVGIETERQDLDDVFLQLFDEKGGDR